MSVTTVRPEVTENRDAWKLVRDAVAGSRAVKAGDYLTPVNAHDDAPENKSRNEARLRGAVYFNATGRTLAALSGMAFGKWPEVVLPKGLEFLLTDADGSGVGLINLSQSAVSEVLMTGRAGLLVDYPALEVGPSRADVMAGNVRPTVTLYPADSIINWCMVRRGARSVLGLVVIKEVAEEWDGFERTEVDQYRVLQLGRLEGEDEAAPERYVVKVYQQHGGNWIVVQQHQPTDAAGRPWQEIPFTFIGATNNDATPDQPPLYDLADLNIAHFRNSADHEESLFFAGQAQVWVTGADIQWLKDVQEAGLYVGSRSIGIAPHGGDVKMVQAQPVTALAEEMERKVERMAQLGARLVAPGEAARTATEAAADEKTSTSILSLVCDNVSDAFRSVLRWCQAFTGDAGETDFSISTEFSGLAFDANQVTAAMALVQGGQMPQSALWSYLRSIGLIAADKSDDDIRDEIEGQAAGLALGDAPEVA